MSCADATFANAKKMLPHSADVDFSGELIVGDSLKKRLNR